MSRSMEDWENARQKAIKMRSLLYQIGHEIDEWPFEDGSRGRCLDQAEKSVDELDHALNCLIGSCTIEWVEEERKGQEGLMKQALIDNKIACACGELGYCEAGPQCGSGG